MNKLIKLSILGCAIMPAFASAQISLYIPTQLDHYDIDGVTGGGPFVGEVLSGTGINQKVLDTQTFYCDSIPQEFYLGETFQVSIVKMNSVAAGSITSLDPWVITNADAAASSFDARHHVTLDNEQIVSAIQGVIWHLDGQISGRMSSNEDAMTGYFANYLLRDAEKNGSDNVGGYVKFDCTPNYANASGVLGQSQVGAAPVPEPSSVFALGLPLLGIAFRRRRSSK